MTDLASTPGQTTEVTTGLYIGGEARDTPTTSTSPTRRRPGVVVGHAAAAHQAGRGRRRRGREGGLPGVGSPAARPSGRPSMAAAIEGIADDRDEDAGILSQENGKVRLEAWVDALVFEIRWNLALSLADEVEQGKVLAPAPGIPGPPP